MPSTYGLIGSRTDLGGLLAGAHLSSLGPAGAPGDESNAGTTWGVGFFEKDEVLLRRGPGGLSDSGLKQQVSSVRSHAFLAHECDSKFGAKSPDATPPLRYGHVLFTCHGVANSVESIVEGARLSLPDFLHRTVRGETLSEIAFALFLAELPPPSLARTRLAEPRRSADPLQEGSLGKALRTALQKLDALCDQHERERFTGDLWIHTGEFMMVAHRQGNLGLQLLRGSRDLERLSLFEDDAPTGIEHSQFVALAASPDGLSPHWERLPENVLVTAARGSTPQTESL